MSDGDSFRDADVTTSCRGDFIREAYSAGTDKSAAAEVSAFPSSLLVQQRIDFVMCAVSVRCRAVLASPVRIGSTGREPRRAPARTDSISFLLVMDEDHTIAPGRPRPLHSAHVISRILVSRVQGTKPMQLYSTPPHDRESDLHRSEFDHSTRRKIL